MTSSPGSLYLIPSLLGEAAVNTSLPALVVQTVSRLKHFLVEDEKSARHFIKKLLPDCNLRELSLERLSEHTAASELPRLLEPLVAGHDVGIISEAGCPAIADPGSNVVRRAHEIGARVIPLVGPCSMILALMASGLSGQRWRFVGYLPVADEERRAELRALEGEALRSGETQIVMETPYRNQRLLQEILAACRPETMLCIASNLTAPEELIQTCTVAEWRKIAPTLPKVPSLFLLGR